jgi:hypothetical protein
MAIKVVVGNPVVRHNKKGVGLRLKPSEYNRGKERLPIQKNVFALKAR